MSERSELTTSTVSGGYLPHGLAPVEVRGLDVGFFEATKEGRLTVQRCASCGHWQHPPREACAACRSFELSWEAVPGTGTVFSYTVVHHPTPVVRENVPYPIILVELDGSGTRLISNLVDHEPEQLRVGERVEVVWDTVSDDITLPRFRPMVAGTD